MKNEITFLLLIILIVSLSSCNQSSKSISMDSKIVIAHRGASGYLPEHTMESKILAHSMNVDYIEQDLVLSKDDIPIVIHDIYLDDVTDVKHIFPDKKREDGRYYVIDFTFLELKQLTIFERFDPKTGKQVYPNRFSKKTSNFKLHSLQEEIEVIQELNQKMSKKIGIYPEIKAPEFHHKEGKDISKIVLEILSDYSYKSKKDKCILQCFDAKELKRIRKKLNSDLFLVQLIEYPEETKQLKEFSTYADGVGPWYKLLFSNSKTGNIEYSNFVNEAHELGLKVHVYTLRADDLNEFHNFEEMMESLFVEAKVDGVFTDFPDLVVNFLNRNNNG